MGKRLDGTSLFTGLNSGLTNTFSLLTGQYGDLTLENLNNSLTNNNVLANNAGGATFAAYMTNNFNNIDGNADGKISASEIQDLMSQMATQGLTREQIAALGSSSGMSTSLQETVLNHFNEIDANKDGKITNQEIQTYGVKSDLEKQKISDRNRMVNNLSMFYDVDSNYEGSLLDYKYLDDENS